jgi:hypothetical protein
MEENNKRLRLTPTVTCAGSKDNECSICLELISEEALCKLPCEHEFHQECVEELRKRGVLQACPLCRAALPDGPQKLYDDAIQIYFAVCRNKNEGTSLHTRAASSRRNIMEEVIFMTTTAANQGHAGAQWFLGEIYHSGLLETTRDLEEAVRWTQKASDQGHAFA